VIRWQEQRALPAGVSAILSGSSPRTDQEWKDALRYTDRFQLTFALVKDAPAWVRAQVESDRARNRDRNNRILALLRDVLDVAAGHEIVVLKGIAHWDLFGFRPDDRVQYDLDLYCPGQVAEVRRKLERFVPAPGFQWNGDFYDAAIPIEIDLHDRLWNEKMEGFAAPGVEQFWERRVWSEWEGVRFQTLAPPDALAHAALHMLKHTLHGEARPAHALELAMFLRHHADDQSFWREWRALHPPELQTIEAIAFRFAAEWFGCPLPEEAERLPEKVERWFARHRASPVTAFFEPNKDELALNLCLIESPAAKARVVGRRLFPAKLPRPFSYAVARAVYHLRALIPGIGVVMKNSKVGFSLRRASARLFRITARPHHRD
jgi:Uncharacterised nucleotidyltransferase